MTVRAAMRGYSNIQSAPAAEPVSQAEAKAQLRVDSNDENDLIDNLIIAARRYVERITGKQLVTATWDYILPAFPTNAGPIELPYPPVQSVTSITYVDYAGSSQTLSSSLYSLSAGSEFRTAVVVPAYNQIWPTTRGHVDDVTIRFVSGFGAAEDVPQEFKQMLLLLIGHWFWNREATLERTVQQIPLAFDALLTATKRYTFA